MHHRLTRLARAATLASALSLAAAALPAGAADYPETPAARAALEARAAAGDADAAVALAMWHRGEALVKNSVASVEPMIRYYRQAAEAGNLEAMAELNSMRYFGNNDAVKARASSLVSQEEAQRWLRLASDKGLPRAMYVLGGTLHSRGTTPEEIAEGAQILLRCTEAGDELCTEAMADAYRDGRGIPQDRAEALRLYEDVIARAYYAASTMNKAGILLHEGVPGRPADQRAALEMFRRSAEEGWHGGMESLAVYHEQGLGGLPASLEEALRWQREARKKFGSDRIDANIARLEAAIAARATAATSQAAPAYRPPPSTAGTASANAPAPQGGGRSTACRAVDGNKADAIAYAESLADVSTWQCTWELVYGGIIHPSQPSVVVEGGVIYGLNFNGGPRKRMAENLRLSRTYRQGIDLVHEFDASCYPAYGVDQSPRPGKVVVKAGFVNNTHNRSVLSYPNVDVCKLKFVRREGARYSEAPYPSM